MASTLGYLYSVLLVVTVFSFSPDSFCAAHQSKPEHKALFVFGDSLFDAGNNQYLNGSGMGASSTKLPYGETYFKHATGRVSDGRIVPDFIAQFAKLPMPPPYLQPGAHHFTDGANFASAGAGVLPGTFPGAISLPSQLSYFKAMEKSLSQRLGHKEAKKLLGRAVYLFSIGGNDYFSFSSKNPKSLQSYKRQYVASVIRNLTSVLKEIYNLGGRKIAFQNVGPLGCVPATKAKNPALGSKCSEEPLTLARLHNRALSSAFKKLENNLPGFKYSIFDYYNALGDRINNPSKYVSFSAHQSKPEANHKALFVFGDSLFDAGNNQYLNTSVEGSAVIWPYGETYFNHPTGRISDGRIVPDFIAQFANLPLPPPYLEPGAHQFSDGTNFASAGAGVLPETQPGTISLPSQLSNFKDMKNLLHQKFGEKEANKLLGRAVYFFSIGGNDYINLFTQNPKAPQSYKRQYVAMVITNLTSVLKEIYDLGGRKIAFQNVAPLGCIPAVKSGNPEVGGKCLPEPLTLARLHNRALSIALKKLENHLPGFKYSIFDYYNALGDRVNNPSKFGFKNGTSACCGSGAYRGSNCGTEPYELCSNPSEYVWFDGGHTTESANLQLAELIWSGPSYVTGPYTMKQLFEHS